ncbi:MAG TPA: thioredoxin domain-containing protein [Kofleriaceae bacterium]|nr:thioredoxin domain-containing protein [Kofleriaceae bacterium]
MKRFAFAALGGLVCASAISCQISDNTTDKKLDQLSARVAAIETQLSRRGPAPAARTKPKRPDPKTVYAVPVTGEDPYRGGEHAKVTVVEAYDFACPYCAMLQPVMSALLDHYDDDDLKVVSKMLVIHRQIATDAALAACAANEQGKFAAFEAALWKSVWELGARPKIHRENLTAAAIEKIAGSAGLDVTKLKEDMAGAGCRQSVARNHAELSRLGVNWTPQIYINGRPYAGPRTVDALERTIDAEIARANEAISHGQKLADYYASLTKDGKKTL